MDRVMADANAPRLGVRQTLQEPRGRVQGIVGDLELAGIDVDRDDLPLVASFHLSADLPFVPFVPEPGVFLFGVTGGCHGYPPWPQVVADLILSHKGESVSCTRPPAAPPVAAGRTAAPAVSACSCWGSTASARAAASSAATIPAT